MYLITILLSLLLIAPVFGQDSIEGPDELELGQLGKYESSLPADSYDWLIQPPIDEADYEKVPKVIFAKEKDKDTGEEKLKIDPKTGDPIIAEVQLNRRLLLSIRASEADKDHYLILATLRGSQIRLTMKKVVVKGSPDPDPNPTPPPPPGKRWIYWVEESGEPNALYAQTINSKRLRDYLEANNHKFYQVDPDQPAPPEVAYYRDQAGNDLPQLFVVGKDEDGKGRILYQGLPEPFTVDTLINLIESKEG